MWLSPVIGNPESIARQLAEGHLNFGLVYTPHQGTATS